MKKDHEPKAINHNEEATSDDQKRTSKGKKDPLEELSDVIRLFEEEKE